MRRGCPSDTTQVPDKNKNTPPHTSRRQITPRQAGFFLPARPGAGPAQVAGAGDVAVIPTTDTPSVWPAQLEHHVFGALGCRGSPGIDQVELPIAIDLRTLARD